MSEVWKDFSLHRSDSVSFAERSDPKRGEYPDAYFPILIPAELRGKYDSPGWAANGVEPWGFEPDPVKAAGAIYYKDFCLWRWVYTCMRLAIRNMMMALPL